MDYAVGDQVMLKQDLYEPPDECEPGGYLARRGVKLIVRRIIGGKWPIHVSHEDITDGRTFGVDHTEIVKYEKL